MDTPIYIIGKTVLIIKIKVQVKDNKMQRKYLFEIIDVKKSSIWTGYWEMERKVRRKKSHLAEIIA